ncbi:MAG: sigma-70 family RNA polymerase sigma factor [Ruminococcus sp.]|nr:sigma-70 family RNA polymerase sigma factor [Ruminococcus sp.]
MNLPDDTDLCQQAEQADITATLLEGLEELNAVEHEMIIRFYFYGEKTSEIAASIGLTDTAVRIRLHRSRGKLRKFMEERGFHHAE